MTSTKRIVTIGSREFVAACPVPREGIGLCEAVALSMRGYADRVRNRDVPDSAHTHSLLRLLARHRRHEAEVVRRIDGALSLVDRALAPVNVTLAEAIADAPEVPTSADLQRLAASDRAAWAGKVRRAGIEGASIRASRQRQEAAKLEAAQLWSARQALSVEGDDVRRQWREAYEMRAARYTRARFGRRGATMADEPGLPPYRPVEAPTVERSDDGAARGLAVTR